MSFSTAITHFHERLIFMLTASEPHRYFAFADDIVHAKSELVADTERPYIHNAPYTDLQD
jgi:hypothetical protein